MNHRLVKYNVCKIICLCFCDLAILYKLIQRFPIAGVFIFYLKNKSAASSLSSMQIGLFIHIKTDKKLTL